MAQYIIEILTQEVNENLDLSSSDSMSYLGIYSSREEGFAAWIELHGYAVIKAEINGTGNHYRDEYIVKAIPNGFDQLFAAKPLLRVRVGEAKQDF